MRRHDRAVTPAGQILGWLAVFATLATRPTRADDWPMYGNNPLRSRVTVEALTFPLVPAWKLSPAVPPSPAWPPPPRLLNKLDFDYAPHPVVARGLVYVGSTTDDTLRAFDLGSGALRWRFTAGGPIRFAPQIHEGKAYLASDDGLVTCLDADTGAQVWTFHAAPWEDRYIGNRRMISRWPCRSGILVTGGVLYAVAGMWPSEGIYVYALDPDTGEVIWVNDSSGLVAKPAGGRWRPGDPHAGEFSFSGPTPQGHLLASRDFLIVPLANNSPATFRLESGALHSFTGNGGGTSTIFMDTNSRRYNFTEFRSGLQLFGLPVPDRGVVRKPGKMRSSPEVPQVSPKYTQLPGSKHGRGKVSAIMHNGRLHIREGYGLALTANALLVGGQDRVEAFDPATDSLMWHAAVEGNAYELAVADGCIVVGTDRGTIHCFSPGPRPTTEGRDEPPPSGESPWPDAPPSARVASVLERIRKAGMGRGFAMVRGDCDGSLAVAMARGTSLHVVSVLDDVAATEQLRAALLDHTPLYGSRLHVLTCAANAPLPFAQYFANVVVLTGEPSPSSYAEACRVLRPYGGVLIHVDGSAIPPALALSEPDQSDAGPELALALDPTGTAAVRGPLPGARDSATNISGDRRVKWPLRPIWFGGPDPAQVMNVDIGAHVPVAANGRYFVLGQSCLTAVDAYNGTVLWSRLIPSATPNVHESRGLYHLIADGLPSHTTYQWSTLKRFIAADADHVYLRLGENYFRNEGEAMIRLDARTGRQMDVAGPFIPGPSFVLSRERSWPLSLDDEHPGKITLLRTKAGLGIRLSRTDGRVTGADAWDLFFDFRPPERRYGLYGPETFSLRVFPANDNGGDVRCVVRTGEWGPPITAHGGRAADVAEAWVDVPWDDRLPGGAPASFCFAATLTEDDGTRVAIPRSDSENVQVRQVHLFGDVMAEALNVGWAVIHLAADGDAPPPVSAPSIVVGDATTLPGDWLVPEVEGVRVGSAGEVDEPVRNATRRHPLTLEPGPRVFRSGTAGCGNPVYSASSIIGRSTKLALGLYDFLDDGGLHFFPGIAANCGALAKAPNMTAALGLLIFSESRSHCDCMIPVRTSMALAPAEKRLNEDWALFCDRDADAPIRHAAVNLGAFGDRRDDAGILWLSFPRASGGKAYPLEPASRRYAIESPPISATLQIPLTIERYPGGGPYRHNADRMVVPGTDKPWLYASGYRGLRKAVFTLQPRACLVSERASHPIGVDGDLSDDAWTDGMAEALGEATSRPPALPFTQTEVRFRHDRERLYVAVRRPAALDRRGAFAAWTRSQSEDDAPVWTDDAFELFLRAGDGTTVLHFGMSASGARFDAVSRNGAAEEVAWNPTWEGAVRADVEGLCMEAAIPWRVLTAAGVPTNSLSANFLMVQKDVSREVPSYPGSVGRFRAEAGIAEPYLSLGPLGRGHCGNFAPLGLGSKPEVEERRFTVRLHFAENEPAVEAGTRAFDVKLQGRTVLESFDIAAECGDTPRAVLREFRHVAARETLTLECEPRGDERNLRAQPILSAIEIVDEVVPAL